MRRFRRRELSLLGVAAGLLIWQCRPSARVPEAQPYFESLALELESEAPRRPVILIDLDRLDANLARVRERMPRPLHLCIVTKSLPSLDLVRHVLEGSGARRLMAFHAPFLPDLIEATRPGVDILLGKPVPAGAAAGVYDALGPAQAAEVSRRVQWLVHDRALLDDYLTFARERGLRLRINVEIDVGLHRGGARDRAELARLLDGIRRAPEHARFSGLMGYDGHVAIRGGVCRDLRAARLPEGCARVAA
jgi:D-serine deaminase-like pyridoxal phosphate-dependent protein